MAGFGLVAGTTLVVLAPSAAFASDLGGFIPRAEVLQRADYWLNTLGANTYCANTESYCSGQGRPWRWDSTHSRTYRPDCSGFVDMSWHLGGSLPNTGSLPDYSQVSLIESYPLNTRTPLQPGDLLPDTYGSEHHAVLFAGWDRTHTSFSYYSFGGGSDGNSPPTFSTTGRFSSSTSIAGHASLHYSAYLYKRATNSPTDLSNSHPVNARDADGGLEVFFRGSDGALWHMWQLTANGTTGWSAALLLGGSVAGSPTVEANPDGRLEVFYRGVDGQLWHIWQLAANGLSGWSTPAALGGDLSGDPTVAVNADGRLEVFFAGTDAALKHIYHNVSDNSWSAPASLGGSMAGTATFGMNADGRLEVFFRGQDGHLWHDWQLAASGLTGWSGVASLGGTVAGDPTVAVNTDGRLEAFYLSGVALAHVYQNIGGAGWSAESSLGGQLAGTPDVAMNPDGRLEVFFRGLDGALWHDWQLDPSGLAGWSGTASLGGELSGDPGLGANVDGRLETFYRGTDGTLSHIYQVIDTRAWSSAGSMGPVVS